MSNASSVPPRALVPPIDERESPPCIAWERVDLRPLERFWQTVRDIAMEPVEMFETLGSSTRIGPAIFCSLVCSSIGHAPLLVLLPCLGLGIASITSIFASTGIGAMPALMGVAVAVLPLALTFVPVFGDALYGLVFHGLAVALGGKGSFAASFRAMFYTGALRFWLLVAHLLFWVPVAGPLLQTSCRAGILFWSGACAFGAAKGVHGLEHDRALIVGVLTPLSVMTLTGLVVGGGLLVFGAAFAATHGHQPW